MARWVRREYKAVWASVNVIKAVMKSARGTLVKALTGADSGYRVNQGARKIFFLPGFHKYASFMLFTNQQHNSNSRVDNTHSHFSLRS